MRAVRVRKTHKTLLEGKAHRAQTMKSYGTHGSRIEQLPLHAPTSHARFIEAAKKWAIQRSDGGGSRGGQKWAIWQDWNIKPDHEDKAGVYYI